MQWSDLPVNPSRRMLRQFAGLWIGFFGALAGWQWSLGRATAGAVCMALALTVGPVGLMAPRLIRPIFVAWLAAAFPIGWLVSRICLLVLFYGVLTPIGLLFRVTGRDQLQLRRRTGCDTYWIPRSAPADATRYYRQS